MDLAGTWALRDVAGEHSAPMDLPGDGISALFAAGLITDPRLGSSEAGLRWIAGRDWLASREFRLDDPHQVLVIDGLDCMAEVRVNGTSVLCAGNAFRTQRVDLSEVAVRGVNRIEILFRSAVAEAARRQSGLPLPVPCRGDFGPIPGGNLLRKAQMDFGWDCNVALVPFGVTTGIRLEPRTRYRILGVTLAQSCPRGRAVVDVSVFLQSDKPLPFDWSVTLCGQTAAGHGVFHDRQDRIDARLVIRDPRLWWPNGMGDQPLHDLTVRVGDQHLTRRVALREVRLRQRGDRAGAGGLLGVNGRDCFLRGAAWIPSDALPGRIRREEVRSLLASARSAGMCMLRIWGGGRYESDWFYETCDEMGLLVWQDLMFAGHHYPATPAFLAEIEAEVEEQALRLGDRVALWCGAGLPPVPGHACDDPAGRDRWLVSRDRLVRTIETTLTGVLPAANWCPAMPGQAEAECGSTCEKRRAGGGDRPAGRRDEPEGDGHAETGPRLVADIGVQSFPSLGVIRPLLAPEDRNISAPAMDSHQKAPHGTAAIAAAILGEFRFPSDFAGFVWLSQIRQGLSLATAIALARSRKPRCMGAMYRQLDDCWPCVSWSTLDHGGGWKLSHHMVAAAFRPIAVVASRDREDFVLKAVNDTGFPAEVTLTATAADVRGPERQLGRTEAAVRTDRAVEMLRIPHSALEEQEVLSWSWENGDGNGATGILAPRPWKNYDLQPSGTTSRISRNGTGWTLELAAAAPAFFLTAEASVPGCFDRNVLSLFPGSRAVLRFIPLDPDASPEFTLRDLHSVTHGTRHETL